MNDLFVNFYLYLFRTFMLLENICDCSLSYLFHFQVNAGPLVLAEAFTKEEEVQRYGQGKVAELREAFRTLMSSCDAGLRVNKTLIGPDQQMYHDVGIFQFIRNVRLSENDEDFCFD